MLWHSTHSNWFKFNAGSRLVHFCFSEGYQKEAQDGVKIFFEQPSPASQKNQPIIKDITNREKTKEKILKLIKRGYLLPTDLLVGLYIMYFAVPKGKDNICMVYNAPQTSNMRRCWYPLSGSPPLNCLCARWA